MNITGSTQNNITILKPHGRVDSESVLDLDMTIQEAFQAGHYRMILDLSKVTYINSDGLRILAATLTQNQTSGGDLILVSPSRKIRRVFHLIGFDNFFRLFDSIESAVQAF